ncbi:MAG TPA: SAM-dependent methyltransferase [Ferruginibacter sp.]|nr:SAM-dependent methyltransferase [Ferruginibacter sp.]
MNSSDSIISFIRSIDQAIADNSFVSITLGNYKGLEPALKNIYIKKTLIKKEEKLSFTYRYQTRDIVKNFAMPEAMENITKALHEGFKFATVFTTQFDLIIEQTKNETYSLKKIAATKTDLPSLQHDKEKKRLIDTNNKPYLHELKITDAAGNVFKATQDKYRQINHYIEILSSLIKELPEKKILNVVDMGSGKGYLTFALYDYLTNVLDVNVQVTGVEFRADLVKLCNHIAANSNFKKLHFEEGTIDSYDGNDTNILIALHACDTATDDAIQKGITANADLIVVAPCCHKQIRREIEKHKTPNDVDFITKHGIFLERQAEMVTDSIRAMVLEYFGYKTKVFEFITDAHTPKNIMIVGIKNNALPYKSPAVLDKIHAAKKYFGVEVHHLEKTMGI